MAYYGEPAEVAYYGEPQEFADYGDGYSAAAPAGYGYYAEPPDYGYYGEQPEMGEYEPPVGYYAEEQPMGGYAQAPEMVGYREYEPLSESPESTGYYAEPDMSGYVRETAEQPFNPGCPMPTNVAGFDEAEPVRRGRTLRRSRAVLGLSTSAHGEPVVRPVYASTRRDRVAARNFQAALVSTRNLKPSIQTGELLWQPSKALERE